MGPGPRLIKKEFSGRGLTKAEKHWFKAFNDRIQNYEARHTNCGQSLGTSSGLAEAFERKEEKTDDKKKEEE